MKRILDLYVFLYSLIPFWGLEGLGNLISALSILRVCDFTGFHTSTAALEQAVANRNFNCITQFMIIKNFRRKSTKFRLYITAQTADAYL